MIKWILLIYGLLNIGITMRDRYTDWQHDFSIDVFKMIALSFFGIPIIITGIVYKIIENIQDRKLYNKRYKLK